MVTDQMNEHSFILYEASREIKEFFAKTRHLGRSGAYPGAERDSAWE